MKLRSTLTTGALGLAVTALAGSGLVAGAAPSLAAAPTHAAKESLSTTYLCSNEILTDQEIPTTFTAKLPDKVRSGKVVKPIAFKTKNTVPEGTTDLLRFLGVTEVSGTSTGATVSVGKQKVKVGKVTIPSVPVPESGALVLNGSGQSKAFRAGKPGTYKVGAPKSFVADLRDQDGETLAGGPLSCTIADGAPTTIGTVKVVR